MLLSIFRVGTRVHQGRSDQIQCRNALVAESKVPFRHGRRPALRSRSTTRCHSDSPGPERLSASELGRPTIRRCGLPWRSVSWPWRPNVGS